MSLEGKKQGSSQVREYDYILPSGEALQPGEWRLELATPTAKDPKTNFVHAVVLPAGAFLDTFLLDDAILRLRTSLQRMLANEALRG